MFPKTGPSSVFDDHDREHAHQRLDRIDRLGAERLFDALWPTEEEKRKSAIRLRDEGRRSASSTGRDPRHV
jgi:hypothetical protein